GSCRSPLARPSRRGWAFTGSPATFLALANAPPRPRSCACSRAGAHARHHPVRDAVSRQTKMTVPATISPWPDAPRPRALPLPREILEHRDGEQEPKVARRKHEIVEIGVLRRGEGDLQRRVHTPGLLKQRGRIDAESVLREGHRRHERTFLGI